jgi:1,4-alpha-glucan branching enzyme
VGGPHRYSAKNNSKPVNFICIAPQARKVALIGDFNDWNPTAHPMKRQPDGAWMTQVPLSHGPHHYLFSIDGKPALDPRARGIVEGEHYDKVSLITLS